MTVRDAAKALEVSEKTVYDLCREGLLEHLRIGVRRGTIRIEPEAIERYKTDARRMAGLPRKSAYALRYIKDRQVDPPRRPSRPGDRGGKAVR